MKPWTRRLYLIGGVAALVVVVAATAQAIRQGSWVPVASVTWLPAVIAACWPGSARRRCLPRRRTPAG